MGRTEKKAYVEAIRQRYKKANRAKKSRNLEEFCETCNYNHKYAIRLLNKKTSRRAPKNRCQSVSDFTFLLFLEHLKKQKSKI